MMTRTGASPDAFEHDQESGLAFLAQAGRVLGASLDYRRTLQGLTEVGLGVFGDACLVGLVDDAGRLRIVAGAHLDRAKRPILDALRDVTITHCSETAAVVRSGRSRVLPAINEGRLRAALDCEAMALIRKLELGPTMIVPLVVRGQRIGVLIFSAPPGSQPYEPTDVALAEELARRAAAAVANARAFAHTSDVAHTLQHTLLPPRLPLIPGIELAIGYMILQSTLPRWLGVWWMVSGVAGLLFLWPPLGTPLRAIILAINIAELALPVLLVVKGGDASRWRRRLPS